MVAGHRGVAKSAATKAISAWHFQVGCQLLLYGAREAITYLCRCAENSGC